MQTEPIMKTGQTVPLTIKRLGINGEGIGYYKRNVVFVKDALPGEDVTAKITSVKQNFAEAKVLNIKKRSPHRQEPLCGFYEQCGGCQLQHLVYPQQLKYKRDIVVQALEKYVKDLAPSITVHPTIGMDNPWRYRNKSQFQVKQLGNKVAAGLYAENSHRLLDIDDCIVQHPDTTRMTNGVKRVLDELNIPIYDSKKHKGLIRTIVVRTGIRTGEIQVALITAKKELPKKELLVERIKGIDPNIVSIVQNINPAKTSIVFGDETIPLWGKDTLHEELGELAFDLSARAFFQLNPEQTVNLYNEIKKAAALSGKQSVVDAYCGVGTIGLWLADQAKEVRGMDVIPDSIKDANANAKKYGFTHMKYVVGTAEEWLAKWRKEGYVPDVLTVDPPRTGLADSLLNTILKVKPKRFVYTSCNPSTLAKDLSRLRKIYDVAYIQPVDMFPQTSQVETVTLLILK